ncbi:hypothetical protein [Streptomyces sp. NPDC059010]|uniref:hypothetical protein n=1 Tax=Streptomyces sp. NPDC059010 TaxID=3346695 RepID=UPI0036A2CA33
MLNPANFARRLVGLHEEIGRPPIWRHDLCRRAATLTHAAGADLGEISEINSPSAHAPLTQTAPDETSEAE